MLTSREAHSDQNTTNMSNAYNLLSVRWSCDSCDSAFLEWPGWNFGAAWGPSQGPLVPHLHSLNAQGWTSPPLTAPEVLETGQDLSPATAVRHAVLHTILLVPTFSILGHTDTKINSASRQWTSPGISLNEKWNLSSAETLSIWQVLFSLSFIFLPLTQTWPTIRPNSNLM